MRPQRGSSPSSRATSRGTSAAAEEHAATLGCVETLGQMQRRVVKLRLLDDVPGEEVAAMLDITPGHVAVLLHRAKDALRTCMIDAGWRAEG